MTERFDWPVTRAALKRLGTTWAGLQEERRRQQATRLFFRALDLHPEEVMGMCRHLVKRSDEGKQ